MLGDLPLAAIDVEVLVAWQDGLEEAGVGAPTLIKAMSIVSSIFREAARRPRSTGVTGNPVALLEKPRARRRRRPLVWGPVVVERVRFQLLVGSRRIGRDKRLAAMRDVLLVSLMEMTGCRPGEALGLRWSDIGERIAIVRRLSGKDIVEGTKTGRHRSVPLLGPLRADLDQLRRLSGDDASEYVFRTPAGRHGSRPTGATTAHAISGPHSIESRRSGMAGGRISAMQPPSASRLRASRRPVHMTSVATPIRR